MRIATCLLMSLAVGSGLYTAAAIGWSLLDPQGAGRTLLFTIPIGIAATAGLGLLAAGIMMLPFSGAAKKRPGRPMVNQRTAPPPARGEQNHADQADLALSA